VEYGKATKSGEIFNDLPDRIADVLILVAAGYAAAYAGADWRWRPVEVGWLAGVLAMGTAYVRVLGKSIGAGTYFIGPMAKQHRMATLTVACLICLIVQLVVPRRDFDGKILSLALWLICLGSAITAVRRMIYIARDVEKTP
jgi:phosphatidylglycerophosphate synthase